MLQISAKLKMVKMLMMYRKYIFSSTLPILPYSTYIFYLYIIHILSIFYITTIDWVIHWLYSYVSPQVFTYSQVCSLFDESDKGKHPVKLPSKPNVSSGSVSRISFRWRERVRQNFAHRVACCMSSPCPRNNCQRRIFAFQTLFSIFIVTI